MKPRHTAEQSTTAVNKAQKMGRLGFGAIGTLSDSTEFKAPPEPITEPVPSGFAVAVMPQPEKVISSVERKEKPEGFVCPIDPAERNLCDSCQ